MSPFCPFSYVSGLLSGLLAVKVFCCRVVGTLRAIRAILTVRVASENLAQNVHGRFFGRKATARWAVTYALGMARPRSKALPKFEQVALARQAATGDRRSAEQLISASKGFIVQRVRKLGAAAIKDDPSLEDDLYAEACRGMYEGLLRYDASRNLHPLTYCAHWIDLRVRNALVQTSGPASVGSPQHWRASGRPRTTAVEIDQTLTDSLSSGEPSALDQLLSYEGHKVHWESVLEALQTLEPTDRRIIELRYLCEPEARRTLVQVGQQIGLSRERTRQREIAALKQLLDALGVPADRLSAVRRLA